MDFEEALDGTKLETKLQGTSHKNYVNKDGMYVAFLLPLFQHVLTNAHHVSSYIYTIFREAGITFANAHRLVLMIHAAVETLNQDSANQSQSSLFRSRGANLTHFGDALNQVFAMDFEPSYSMDPQVITMLEEKNSQDFKVHIAEIEPTKKGSAKDQTSNPWDTVSKAGKPKGKSLHFWCLRASYAMQDLPNLGVRSVLLTSGTLSPMQSFINEVGLPFEVVFQNSHVITSKQCRVGILEKVKVNNVPVELKSTYQCRENKDYMQALGNALINMSRRTAGGILVFFPSYTLLEACSQAWQQSTVFKTLNDARKVIVEPRGKTQFSRTYEEFDMTIKEKGGAILMAVCRGKASEGIDFSDYQSRLVVIVGLPYPPIYDARVMVSVISLNF